MTRVDEIQLNVDNMKASMYLRGSKLVYIIQTTRVSCKP